MNAKARFVLGKDGVIKVIECPSGIRECEVIKRIGCHPVIVAYLLYVGKAEVVNEEGKSVNMEELIERVGNRNLWILFSTYLDLRKRGKIPEFGAEPNELVIDRERTCIYVYEENAMVTPSELLSIVEKSIRKECRAIMAVVDMYGDVTYYEVSKMSFPKIERR